MGQKLISKVWRITGLFSNAIPGALVLQNGQVAFITQTDVQFNVPLSEMKDIKWPFIRMGLGFNAVVNDKKYKFSFSKPNPSSAEITIINGNPLPKVIFKSQHFDDISSLKDLKKDKATARLWKVIFDK